MVISKGERKAMWRCQNSGFSVVSLALSLLRAPTADDKPAHLAPVSSKPKGGRGNKGGINAATREHGVDRTEAQRSIKIDASAAEAKAAIVDAGLADNQSALLKIAARRSRISAECGSVSVLRSQRQTGAP
jgi:hypothetical protein